MEGVKGLFTSKTFWGVIVSVISKGLLAAGFTVDNALEAEITNLIIALIGFGGDGFAIYGRVKATKKIGK